MLIWLSLLIPLVGATIMLKWFAYKVKLWEILLPLIVSVVFIVSFKAIVEKVEVSSKEWWGHLGIRAEYYEPWSTWIDETCYRDVPCGTDSKGNTKYCSESYDCSHCDDHDAEYKLIDDGGNDFVISKDTYEYLTKRWHAVPQFVDMDRNISHHHGCGQDGNMYNISWDNQILTSVPTTTQHTYENRVKCAVSSFNYPKIDESDKEIYGLFDYPAVDEYSQSAILGTEQFEALTEADKDTAETYAKYLCGYYGRRKQMKLWVLLYRNKPSISADMQEAYWVGGNKNEVVICIGLNDICEMQWVKAFSWTPNRTMLVDIRENLMSQKKYDFKAIYPILYEDLGKFERRQFREFSYISVEPPTWSVIITYLVVLLLTISIYIMSYKRKMKRRY